MDKATYQKRLEAIIEEAKTGSMLAGSNAVTIQAICLLNEEAIGEDEPREAELFKRGDDDVSKYYRNQLRQELKAVIGTSNE